MTLLSPSGGRSPERRGSTPFEASQQGNIKLERRFLELHRQIGAKTCDLMSSLSPKDPFNLVFSEGEMGDIAEKAVLKTLGKTNLSPDLPSYYEEVYKIEEGREIGKFIETYSSDLKFIRGVNTVKDCAVNLKPFIEEKIDYKSSPKKKFTFKNYVLGEIELPYGIVGKHLDNEPRGITLIEMLLRTLKPYYDPMPTFRTEFEGIKFGVDLFIIGAIENTKPHIPELVLIQKNIKAIKFLKQIDLLISSLELIKE